MEKERIQYWDILKAFLIFCVCLGHFTIRINVNEHFHANFVLHLVYFFSMPAFVFVSGFFSKNSCDLSFKTINRIFIFFILAVLFKLSISLIAFATKGKFSYTFLSEKGAPWYLFALCAWFVMLPLFAKLPCWSSMIISLAAGLICGLQPKVNSVLCASRIIVFLPFFLAGFYFKNSQVDFLKKWYIRLLSMIFIVGTIILFYKKLNFISKYVNIFYGNSGYNSIFKNHTWLYGPLLRFIWYISSFIMTLSIMAWIPRKMPDFICRIGRNTLSVYILHRLVCAVFDELPALKTSLFYNRYGILIAIGLSVLCSFIFSLDFVYFPFRKFLSINFFKNQEKS